jgi:hypothetical protein
VEPSQPIPAREMERTMKLQDVILKAMAKKLTGIEAAEIAGMSVRNMQRKRQAYQELATPDCSISGAGKGASIACRWRRQKRCWRCIKSGTSI